MCGIAGIFNYADASRRVDGALLERMTRALAHRGPDGEGLCIDGPVGLGNRRLAIVDLTPAGAQPMRSDDGRCWITYNGEFYNHTVYRAELARGHVFRGTSDTETLLHLVADRGPDALEGVAGIFAFGFWDGRDRSLTLARDPLGVKQVYYWDDGQRLLFASEIKAILECAQLVREIDVEAVNQYLHFHTPLFDRTFFKGVRQLRPGEWLRIRHGGRRERRMYWQVTAFDGDARSVGEQVEALRGMLDAVVSAQLMSDVPMGAFFSGGLDSATVAWHARRSGKTLPCFGVHFSGQGVIDERPFQEAAARAMGMELNLITIDGRALPDDLRRVMWHQDEPVIGAAMLPMYEVSRLAAHSVKVCLGGQAGDEIFGGYARYSLAHPCRSALSIVADALRRPVGAVAGAATVEGNLSRQIGESDILRRLARNAWNVSDWRRLYFNNTCQVPEAVWRQLLPPDDLVSRENCWVTFCDAVEASPARDPATKAMHWDTQAYLPGLFQQDDRMSMAVGLESRVPLADPRLVRFAFELPLGAKLRDGATKWILRRAAAEYLPSDVLNRRKVGFDTPIEHWMRDIHSGWVRETLLSRHARERGLWNFRALEGWLDRRDDQRWADVVWKALCIETWAQIFLDTSVRATGIPELAAHPEDRGEPVRWRDRAEEVRELGVSGASFRATWEACVGTGLVHVTERTPPLTVSPASVMSFAACLPFDPAGVRAAMAGQIPQQSLDRLACDARASADGHILCFGHWYADYGKPIDWQLNPANGRRWDARLRWSRALRPERRVGDVKLTWEVARFPQAYLMARAAAHAPAEAADLGRELADQIVGFAESNPYGRGIHWVSGQEIVFRLMAWLFAASTFGPNRNFEAALRPTAQGVEQGAAHVERYLEYSRQAVYNNHLLSESVGLLLAGTLLPQAASASRWRGTGIEILTRQADAQVYADGGYIQQSHTYARVAMQIYLWASSLLRCGGQTVPRPWTAAMERTLDFLHAQQNPADGRLPNYGANDGALPSVLSTCDVSDFRPLLQALSLATRGERIYDRGPWDEEAAWLIGPRALEAPLRQKGRRSISFRNTGYHVLRGRDPATFAVLRCGSLSDRFSQMDMLAVDVWWRGHNVLVDGGSYLYSGPRVWHEHFLRTASHNTITVDGRDQMLHFRKFKVLYWTEARLLRFETGPGWGLCEGEHYGYRRHPGQCVHKRSLFQVDDGLWIVVDRIAGTGEHDIRLQWLGGEFPFESDRTGLSLETPDGVVRVAVLGADGRRLDLDVVAGRTEPPRGWLSRYYGEKVPVPSLVVERRSSLPAVFVTIVSAGPAEVRVEGPRWEVSGAGRRVAFSLDDGSLVGLVV